MFSFEQTEHETFEQNKNVVLVFWNKRNPHLHSLLLDDVRRLKMNLNLMQKCLYSAMLYGYIAQAPVHNRKKALNTLIKWYID
jgi:hypothetical protein